MQTGQLENDLLEKIRARHLVFDLMDVKSTAKMLGVCVRTVRRWEAAGRMPPRVRHGHRLKYRKADIECLLALQCKDLS